MFYRRAFLLYVAIISVRNEAGSGAATADSMYSMSQSAKFTGVPVMARLASKKPVLPKSEQTRHWNGDEDSALFPTPPNLESNIAFWKKIFTEVSLYEGLLHDRNYPMIIYGKIDVGTKSGKHLDEHVERAKGRYRELIRRVREERRFLWGDDGHRIAALFSKYAPMKSALDSAEYRIRFQLGQRERFREGVERSGAYIDTMRSILREFGVPQRLAFLPHVESSFNPNAYSKAGAAGLWQIMPSTGRELMRIDEQIDERRDPIFSTVAAARILSANFGKTGSWPLAISAYNHGLTGILRAAKAAGSSDLGIIVEKHESESFRFASKNFYSCFVAASEVAADPYTFFGPFVYHPKSYYRDLVLDSNLTLSEIAHALGTLPDTLAALNPSIRPEFFGKGRSVARGFALRIDAGISLTGLIEKFARAPAMAHTSRNRSALYTIKPGDNLGRIASQFSVPVSEILSLNRILNPDKMIAGHRIMIPKREANPVSGAGTLFSQPLAITWPMAPESFVPDTVISVAPGDSGMHAITESTPFLAPVAVSGSRADSADQSGIRKSVALRTGPGARVDSGEYALEFVADTIATITILSYETIGHYASWLKVSREKIMRMNRIRHTSPIRAGQRLRVPLSRPDAVRFCRKRRAHHVQMERAFFSRFRIAEFRVKIMRKGETMWNVLTSNGNMPMWLLKKYNPDLDLNRLFPGTRIQIPVLVPVT